MAYRRCFTTLTRQTSSLLSQNPHSLHPLKSLISHLPSIQRLPHILSPQLNPQSYLSRKFSSRTKNPKNPRIIDDEDDDDHDVDGEDDEDEDDEEEEDYSSQDEGEVLIEPSNLAERSYFVEDKIQEAAHIGYKVVGPLEPGDRVFKPYEPAYAIVQVGSHQFKVSNGDCIYVEKLKYCEVNDKLILTKALMAGSPTQTMIGRPILPDVTVHAVVEEHALDAKVIIFKKKRRKNYRRTKGHRQELTRLRITEIEGIEKPETPLPGKTPKTPAKKVEKVAVAA